MCRTLLLLCFICLSTSAVQAQTDAGKPTISRWNVGLKLGSGLGYSNGSRDAAQPWTAFTGGLTAGYRPGSSNFMSTLQADVLLERRPARPWQTGPAQNLTLFVPFYLRTDPAAARLHLLLGGGPTFWLRGQQVPGDQRADYATRAVEATVLVGLEVRLLPLRFCETTLGLTYRLSMTPDLLRYRSSLGGISYTDEYKHRWLGATLNVYLHPSVSR
jgi:hypothetical protein